MLKKERNKFISAAPHKILYPQKKIGENEHPFKSTDNLSLDSPLSEKDT